MFWIFEFVAIVCEREWNDPQWRQWHDLFRNHSELPKSEYSVRANRSTERKSEDGLFFPLFSVLIGIEEGFVDVICSIRNSNFLVLNDHRIFYEHQSLTDDEPVIRDYDLTNEDLNFGKDSLDRLVDRHAKVSSVFVWLGVLYSDPSDIVLLRNLSSRHRLTLLISPTNIDFTQDNLRCLLVDQPMSRSRVSDLVDPPSSSSQSGIFFLSDYRAIHLSTGSPSLSSKTFGYVKVYQSRMNIDLFVFFSVFFSSFFLFLSIGICFWKVKFAYELHRRRRTIKHEYHKRMARPFSKIQLFIKPSTILAADLEDKSEQVGRRRLVWWESVSLPFSCSLPNRMSSVTPSIFHFFFHPLRQISIIHLMPSLSNRCAIKRLATPPCFSIYPAISRRSIGFVRERFSLRFLRIMSMHWVTRAPKRNCRNDDEEDTGDGIDISRKYCWKNQQRRRRRRAQEQRMPRRLRLKQSDEEKSGILNHSRSRERLLDLEKSSFGESDVYVRVCFVVFSIVFSRLLYIQFSCNQLILEPSAFTQSWNQVLHILDMNQSV